MDEITTENGSSTDDGNLQQKINQLEMQNKKIHSEFNTQRAKLKELYVQKEAEYLKAMNENKILQNQLDEMKSQFTIAECKTENQIQLIDRKAQEEILSLQQLVQDTIEESTICKSDLQNIREEFNRLKQENRELRDELQQQQQETPSLAPVLSQVRKTIARKLGGESGSVNQDSLDDSMRKVNKYAQEDAEVLRSLVVPLEEEIKALKEKLRSTDQELQLFRNVSDTNDNSTIEKKLHTPNLSLNATQDSNKHEVDFVNKSTSMEFTCETCQQYKDKHHQVERLLNDANGKIESLQKVIIDSKGELQKEAALRKDLEDQWNEKREDHKSQVQTLNEQVKKNEKELLNLQQHFHDTKESINRKMFLLTEERERVNDHLEKLQNDNDFLSGYYLATSEELELQRINLPNNVEELHELLLKQQDELIQARVGCEYEKKKCVSYTDETQILRDQLKSIQEERMQFEKTIQSQTKSLESRLRAVLTKEQNNECIIENLERKEIEANKQISELRVQIIELQEANEKLNNLCAEYKSKVKTLQTDFSNSEHVQKDFVKLSQTLQMSLEKIRQSETEVRWQNDEDVDNCPNCKSFFTVTSRKHHCRHCGGIYCEKCLSKTVPSGPRKKPAHVCDICHTLLTPNTAPYFSYESMQSSA